MIKKSQNEPQNIILTVEDLEVAFETPAGTVNAVNAVGFTLAKGEILGVVGESGCGKSVMSRALLGLLPSPPAVTDSKRLDYVNRRGETVDLSSLKPREYRNVRGNEIAMIFQEPMTALNPLFTVGNQLTEHVIAHENLSQQEANERALNLLAKVGIPSPEVRINDYPHQLSGGMRQRVMIAMAIICNPRVLIADEPTTALDVTIQAQILKLLKDIQGQDKTSVIFISHDLAVISAVADKIIVMYLGRIVEEGKPKEIFSNPRHPYTIALLNSLPKLDQSQKEGLEPIAGVLPDPVDPPTGCSFNPRCAHATDLCRQKGPDLEPSRNGGRVACWLYAEGSATDPAALSGQVR